MKLTYNGKSSFSTFCSLLKTLQEEVQRFVRLTKMEWMMIQLQLCFPPSRERGKSPTISPLNFQRQMARRSTVQRTSTRSFDVAREFEFGFDKQTASDLSAYRSKRPFIGGRESRKEKPFFGLFCGEQYSRFLPCFDVRFRIVLVRSEK